MDNPPPTEPATKGHQNRLAREKSPYLLQHASNPVDWYPWGEEAFALARRLNRPLFLSIGYSTCHWCHVMERESFEDPEVARLLNESFVCIKVDREERPDIDAVYMTVCQMMTGSGGWPLTLLLTPDRRPFFAATYIPRTSRFGHAGLLELIPQVRELWATRQAEVLATAGRVASALRQTADRAPGEELGAATLRRAYDQLAARFDAGHGGFGDAPKFPTPHNLSFLLRYRQRTGTAHALAMVERTLRRPDGRLLHRYRDGEAAIPAHADDYAFLIWGLVELYQATFEVRHLQAALDLNRDLLRHFWDERGGGFHFTADDAEELLVRQKDIYDGAVPSANSVAMLNLLRLARITGDASLEERAARIGRAFASDVQQAPMAYTQLMIALELAVGPSREIVIAGRPQADDTRGMLRALRARFLPNAVVLLRPTDVAEPEIIRLAPFTRGQVATHSQATAYVCQGGSCNRPTTSIAEMIESLAPTPPSKEQP